MSRLDPILRSILRRPHSSTGPHSSTVCFIIRSTSSPHLDSRRSTSTSPRTMAPATNAVTPSESPNMRASHGWTTAEISPTTSVAQNQNGTVSCTIGYLRLDSRLRQKSTIRHRGCWPGTERIPRSHSCCEFQLAGRHRVELDGNDRTESQRPPFRVVQFEVSRARSCWLPQADRVTECRPTGGPTRDEFCHYATALIDQ